MNLLMSDISLNPPFEQNAENKYIDLSKFKISNCIGCFGCWIKTPGKCVIRDDAAKIYPLIAGSCNVIYVSKLFCGSYDTTMKTILERAIPIQQAFIRIYSGETHHFQRNVVPKNAVIIGYGSKNKKERIVFENLIERNSKNMLFNEYKVVFADKENLSKAVDEAVKSWRI